jgi:hypothetical protein
MPRLTKLQIDGHDVIGLAAVSPVGSGEAGHEKEKHDAA